MSDRDSISPSGGNGWAWIREEIGKKTDQKWAEAKMEDIIHRIHVLEESHKEVKKIGNMAREEAMKPHDCKKEDILNRMETKVDSWTTWWKRSMVTLITVVVVAAGALAGWLYSHKVLRDDVDHLTTTVQSVQSSMNQLSSDQKELSKDFKENIQKMREDQIDEMKIMFESVLKKNHLIKTNKNGN